MIPEGGEAIDKSNIYKFKRRHCRYLTAYDNTALPEHTDSASKTR